MVLKIDTALGQAWNAVNNAHTTDPMRVLNERMQELIPGPYIVKIESAPLADVGDNPALLLKVYFTEKATDAEILMFKLRHF